MSYNSQNTPFVIRRNNADAAAAADGYNLNDLEGCMEAAYEGQQYVTRNAFRRFRCRITGEEYLKMDGATIDWKHLSGLVREAVEASGFENLPWNLDNLVNANVAPGSYPFFASEAGKERVVKKVQRFCGWLRAAAKLPGVRRVIEKTQSSCGMWSPRTLVHLWDLASHHPSPGALERKLWSVRRRADAIFSAYKGEQKASWASIAQSLLITQQTGKAAVMAVAGTLSGDTFRMYRNARDWLVELHLCSKADQSDGVIARREATPRFVKLGIAVYRIALQDQYHNWSFQWLVRTADGRTYHSNWGGVIETLHDALHAWKEQDKLAAMEADFMGFLKGEEG